MTKKRFKKLLRAAMVQCYALNKANGGAIGTPKALEDSFRKFKLAEGETYAETWAVLNNALRGVVPACR